MVLCVKKIKKIVKRTKEVGTEVSSLDKQASIQSLVL